MSHITALPLRLQGVVNFLRAPWDRREIRYFCTKMAISQRSHHELGISTELHGVPTAFYLVIACALMAIIELSRRALRVHCAFTALTLRWRRFCLHSRIVEITVHVWPCINRMPSSSHARTHRLLSLGVFLRLRLRIISTASASSICLKCISVLVQRMFICIHHSIDTILFGLFNVMKTPICAMIAVAAPYNCCRSAVRKIALLVTAIDAPWKPGRTQWGCKERRRLV